MKQQCSKEALACLLLNRHSFSVEVPTCPSGTRLFDGYSFFGMHGDGQISTQDLGILHTYETQSLLNSTIC